MWSSNLQPQDQQLCTLPTEPALCPRLLLLLLGTFVVGSSHNISQEKESMKYLFTKLLSLMMPGEIQANNTSRSFTGEVIISLKLKSVEVLYEKKL